jgi:hypothetical protein
MHRCRVHQNANRWPGEIGHDVHGLPMSPGHPQLTQLKQRTIGGEQDQEPDLCDGMPAAACCCRDDEKELLKVVNPQCTLCPSARTRIAPPSWRGLPKSSAEPLRQIGGRRGASAFSVRACVRAPLAPSRRATTATVKSLRPISVPLPPSDVFPGSVGWCC